MKWKFMVADTAAKFEAVRPLMVKMNLNRVSDFAALMADCRAAAEAANKLEAHIRDCKINADELVEGMSQDDREKLRDYLDELDKTLGQTNLYIYGLGRFDSLFANLETAALMAEEEKTAAEAGQ